MQSCRRLAQEAPPRAQRSVGAWRRHLPIAIHSRDHANISRNAVDALIEECTRQQPELGRYAVVGSFLRGATRCRERWPPVGRAVVEADRVMALRGRRAVEARVEQRS